MPALAIMGLSVWFAINVILNVKVNVIVGIFFAGVSFVQALTFAMLIRMLAGGQQALLK